MFATILLRAATAWGPQAHASDGTDAMPTDDAANQASPPILNPANHAVDSATTEHSATTNDKAPLVASPLPNTGNLDGLYITLGPVAAIMWDDRTRDGGFGGEAMLIHLFEHRRLAAMGLAAGGVRHVSDDRGRLWVDALVGTSALLGIPIGLSGGVTAHIGRTQALRLGWQITLSGYVGVTPYLRTAHVQTFGTLVDIGMKVPLPALRWR